MYRISKELYFPPVETASPEGILAFGGDLSSERLLLAYQSGIFPWFEAGEPILWWSPNPRMVLFLDELKVSKSMRNILNRAIFKVTFNQDFRAVISNCQNVKRDGQNGTWITNEMIEAYCKLHELGIAKSVEVWKGDNLVGGLYGVHFASAFFGESMFMKVSNASKVAFHHLMEILQSNEFTLLDTQFMNDNVERYGAVEIKRSKYEKLLSASLQKACEFKLPVK